MANMICMHQYVCEMMFCVHAYIYTHAKSGMIFLAKFLTLIRIFGSNRCKDSVNILVLCNCHVILRVGKVGVIVILIFYENLHRHSS